MLIGVPVRIMEGYAAPAVRHSMRYPLNANKQVSCPVCKKPGPGTKSPVTPRPEAVSLSFTVLSHVHGRSYPVFLGSMLTFGWDSGVSKHPQSRSSIGAAFTVAKKDGRDPEVGEMELHFCSTRCLRRFLKDAVDELDQRIAAERPALQKAKKSRRSGGAA
jgi:hypothetical protein